ncbi:hypothetical protein PVAND_001349 [Polypedilum vanderplanki]|uniref:Signal transducer and activator of transcription n=1 Tax=Polypedilum vanderplanki TaxID=319348 RepID=A0A9J6BN72_POLVA|nr:hypothetical protein PVAND_001349 [Polypedilum vanderplanki]
MSLWNQLVQLQPSVINHLTANYGDHFPIEIRQYLAEWLENRLIKTVPENEQSVECLIFFEEFLQQLQKKASEMDNIAISFRLSEAARNIGQTYASDKLQLYKRLRQNLQYEENLLRNPRVYLRRDINREEYNELSQVLETLILKTREIENENRALKNGYERFYLQYYKVAKKNRQYEIWISQQPENRTEIEARRNEHNESVQQLLNFLKHKKLSLIDKLKIVIAETDGVQNTVLEKYLHEWLLSQRSIAMGGFIKTSIRLETIQKWCEYLAEILWTVREQVKILRNSSQQMFQVYNDQILCDTLHEIFETVTKLVEKLIIRSFIIEKQPPQVIGTRKKFESTVRLLIGNKLNINMFNPQVTAKIISEKQAREIRITNQCYEGCETIINNTGYMEYSETLKQMSLSFNNMILPIMKKEMCKIRKERTGMESVSDKKFALLFQSTFSTGDMSFNVWAISLPIVVTSHTNQKPEALATITWDNAFSEINREPFVVPEKVPVTRFAEALNVIFRSKTDRNLTDENLHFLCEKVTRMKLPMPLPDDVEVSWQMFCKDPLPNRAFNFWTWFYETMELTKSFLSGPWKDGLIMGFVERESVERKLLHCQNGTFLLRFAESELGGVTIAVVQNNFVTHIEPFTETVLKIRSLADAVRDIEGLTYLYPCKPINEAFKSHITPKSSAIKGPYVKSELRMSVPATSTAANNQITDDTFTIYDDQQFYSNCSNFLPNFTSSFSPTSSYQVFTSSC